MSVPNHDAIEFIGFAAPRHTSETHAPTGPAIDRDYLHSLRILAAGW